jgi:hypothetical protein
MNIAFHKLQSSNYFDNFQRYLKYLMKVTQLYNFFNRLNLSKIKNPQTLEQKKIVSIILNFLIL